MKFTTTLFLILASKSLFCQSFQLIPDSCTVCNFLSSTGGNSWNTDKNYIVNPENDTLFNGNIYHTLSGNAHYNFQGQPFGFRQLGNKLFAVVNDSINEFLIMDFDAQIGDTIYNLYSEGISYDAKVIALDSILLNNGSYHRSLQLEGIRYIQNNTWNEYTWFIEWNERAICKENGGFLYNIPSDFYVFSIPYAFANYCTTDTRYTNSSEVSCINCVAQTSSLEELNKIIVEVSPNPFESQITFNSEDIDEIQFLTPSGNVLLCKSSTKNIQTIDLVDFASGVYFVRFKKGNTTITQKIIKR